MTNERIVLLGVLTALMFGVFSFSQSGTFILPFSLFKPMIFIVALALVINSKKRPGLMEYLLLSWSFFMALSSMFVHQIVFSQQFYESHVEQIGNWSSLFSLIYLVLLLTWQLFLAIQDNGIYRWLQIINAGLMFTCLILAVYNPMFYIWLLVPTAMWIISVFAARKDNTLHAAMAGFMTFVIGSSWISAVYFGIDPVIKHL